MNNRVLSDELLYNELLSIVSNNPNSYDSNVKDYIFKYKLDPLEVYAVVASILNIRCSKCKHLLGTVGFVNNYCNNCIFNNNIKNNYEE